MKARLILFVVVSAGLLLAGIRGAPGAAAQTVPSPGGPLMPAVIPQPSCRAASPGASGAGLYPISSYTIDYDGGGFTDVSRKAVGSLTDMTFATVRWVVGVGTWLIGWAFSFGFANRLAAPMAAVAGRYQRAFFVPLLGFALLLSAAYGAIQVFRGRVSRGVGEFALSLLLVAAFATWLLADPQGFLDAAFRVTAQLAGSVATVALPAAPAGCQTRAGSYALPGIEAAVIPLTDQIERSFIAEPYDLLQWGTEVPPPCQAAADAVLAAGAGGDRNQIVSAMDTPACQGLYAFNREPSTERLGVAVLVLFASAILMLSLAMVAGTVVLAQVVAVALIALMPFAALAAALPGSGRAVMWWWGTAFVRALATIVVMSGFLVFLLLAADALLAANAGQSLLAQMAVLNLVAILGFSLRRRIARSGKRAAEGTVERLRSPRRFPGAFPAPAARPSPPALPRMATTLGPPLTGDPLAARVTAAVRSQRSA